MVRSLPSRATMGMATERLSPSSTTRSSVSAMATTSAPFSMQMGTARLALANSSPTLVRASSSASRMRSLDTQSTPSWSARASTS